MAYMPRWFKDQMKVYRDFKELKPQVGELMYISAFKDWKDDYHNCNAMVRVNKVDEDESLNTTDVYGGDVYHSSLRDTLGKRPTLWERFRYYIWWNT